jgi:uncharacterized damage-inducible protein DinB
MKDRPKEQPIPEAFRQMVIGHDYESPEMMLRDLDAKQATVEPQGCPYSIAAQTAHMLFWQKRFLDLIQDRKSEPKRGKHGDWPAVAPSQWRKVRADFLSSLKEVERVVSDPDLCAKKIKKTTGSQLVTQIILHNSYHLGQIALLRQLMGLWPVEGGTDKW